VIHPALRGLEGELCGHSSREDVLVALEPRVQVTAAVAELAQPLVCMSRLPPVLLGPIDLLGRVGSRLPPSPRSQRPAPPPKQQLSLALEVSRESRMPFPILGHGDG
jgi:hypothetical protein